MKTNKFKKFAAVLLSGTMLSGVALTGAQAAGSSADAQDTELVLEDGTYVPGEAIICFSGTGNESSEVCAANDIETETLMSNAEDSSEVGASIDGSSSSGATITLVSSDTLTTEELIGLYEGRSDVLSAEPNYYATTESVSSDPYNEWQWNEDNTLYTESESSVDINAQSVWNTEADSSDAPVVAVVDTGVDYTHPDLKDVMWDDGLNYPELVALGGGKYGINTGDGGENSDDPMDTTIGHGTHCAGIIAAQWNNDEGVAGISDDAEIMAVRFLGSLSTCSGAIEGYNYLMTAAKAGVNLVAVNNSWGSEVYSEAMPYSTSLAMDMLGRECGVVSVVSAGNSNVNNDLNTGSILQSPYIITVGASDSLGKKVSFSQYGKETVDVFAPGSEILSATTLYTSEEVNMDSHEMQVQYLPQMQDADDSYFVEDFESGSSVVQMVRIDSNFDIADDETTLEDGANGGSALSVSLDDTTSSSCIKVTVDKSALTDIDTENDLCIAFSYRACNVGTGAVGALYCADKTPLKSTFVYNGQTCVMYCNQYDSGWNQFSWKFDDPSVIKNSVDEDGNFTFYFMFYNYSNTEGESASLRIDNFGLGKTASNYCYASGTSMATPVVTGEAALLYSRYGYSCEELIARIKGGVTVTDEFEELCLSGGNINVEKAAQDPNPVVNNLTVTDDTAVIDGYFFGESGATVTVGDTECEVLSQTDNEITISLPGTVSGHSLVTVTDASGAWGRNYFDINGDGSRGFTDLSVPDDLTFKTISSDSLSGKDAIYFNAAAAGSTVLYAAMDGDCFECMLAAYNTETDEWTALPALAGDNVVTSITNMAAGETKIYMTYAVSNVTLEEYIDKKANDSDNLNTFMDEHSKYYFAVYDTTTGEISSAQIDYRVYSSVLAVYENQLISIGGSDTLDGDIAPEISLLNPVTGKIIGSSGLPDITDSTVSTIWNYTDGQATAAAYVNGSSIIIAGRPNAKYTLTYEPMFVYDGSEWTETGTEFFSNSGEYYDEGQTVHTGVVPVDGGLLAIGPVANLGEEDMADCWTYTVDGGDWSANTSLLFSGAKTTYNAAAVLNGKVYCIGYNISDIDNPFVFRCADVEYSGAPTADPYILGDVNEDGAIDICDATEVQKYAAEIITLSNGQKLAADVNGDDKVTIEDATEIQKYIALIITEFSAAK